MGVTLIRLKDLSVKRDDGRAFRIRHSAKMKDPSKKQGKNYRVDMSFITVLRHKRPHALSRAL